MKTKIIVIVGPTAVGKTALAIDLAQALNGEIISGDSQQVYRKLDIGTAKATPEEQAAAPHHLIDVREVTESYSAFDFVREAKTAIEDITARGKLPIIAGGTGLYIQSLLEGYHLGGEVPHEEILSYRAQLDLLSDEDLYQRVAEQGLVIPQLNRRRAMRALEIAHFGQDLANEETDYEPYLICLDDDRSFKGEQSLAEASEILKRNTRRFAKRQLTWFRNRMEVKFYAISAPHFKEQVLADVKEFLQHD